MSHLSDERRYGLIHRMGETTMGGRLRAARKAASLSQGQLAKKSGLNQGTISDIENDHQGSAYAPELAAALGIEALWLKTGQGPRKRSEGRVDQEALKDALVAVLRVTGTKESPERIAKLAAALYEAAIVQNRLDTPALLGLLRAVS